MMLSYRRNVFFKEIDPGTLISVRNTGSQNNSFSWTTCSNGDPDPLTLRLTLLTFRRHKP